MAVERTGVYPGTFDPITSGHMEVVRRSLRLVDKLVIGPAMSISKGPMFSLEERIDIIKDDISDFPQADRERIEIVPFEGLLIHFARKVNASVIIRGLRAVSDFEYEIQMANMNARMEPNVDKTSASVERIDCRSIREMSRLLVRKRRHSRSRVIASFRSVNKSIRSNFITVTCQKSNQITISIIIEMTRLKTKFAFYERHPFLIEASFPFGKVTA